MIFNVKWYKAANRHIWEARTRKYLVFLVKLFKWLSRCFPLFSLTNSLNDQLNADIWVSPPVGHSLLPMQQTAALTALICCFVRMLLDTVVCISLKWYWHIVFQRMCFTFSHNPLTSLKKLSHCPRTLSVQNSGRGILKSTSAKSEVTEEKCKSKELPCQDTVPQCTMHSVGGTILGVVQNLLELLN